MIRATLNRLFAMTAVLVAPAGLPVAAAADIEVDVELVLAVDVSRSMSPRELEIQRRGYAEALVSPDVVSAIRKGLLGRVALRYVEWAGSGSQRVVVDWTVIANLADARSVSQRLVAKFDTALRRTSISSAIEHSTKSFADNGFTSNRQVIDISGDGPNNSGSPVVEARDAALAQGIIINGLPLMTKDGFYSRYNLEDLDVYYRECVIGGPASFVIPVLEWSQFPVAVRQKLVQELAVTEPIPVRKATFHIKPQSDYDCLIGEKMWLQRSREWIEEP